MGMYTEVFFRGEIRKDAPAGLHEWLRNATSPVRRPIDPFDDHRFFSLPRWSSVFGCSSAHFPTVGSNFKRRTFGTEEVCELFIHSSLKNYDDEIETFFEWISPFVEGLPGDFIGYSLYEDTKGDYDDWEIPTMHFLPRSEL